MIIGSKSKSVAELQAAGVLLVEDGNHGENRPRPNEFAEEGTSFIRAADMSNGKILFQSASRINDTARHRVRKGIGQPGDVLISHKGTVGKVARAPMDAPSFVCSPQTTFYRALDPETLDRAFLYYYLQSPAWMNQLRSRKSETDMADYVSLTEQRRLRLFLPSVEQQRAIAHALGALDHLIDTSRRLVKSLNEASAAAFVLVQESSGELVPQAIEGLCSVRGGSTPRTSEPSFWDDGTIAWATPKDLSSLPSAPLLETGRRITDAGLAQIGSGLLPAGTLLMSSRAPVGYLAIAEVPLAVNQGFIALVCDKGVSNLYLWQWLTANMDRVLARANGSTFQEISKANFRPILVDLPDPDARADFDRIATPLYRSIVELEREIASLQRVRSELLPLLMSGRVVPGEVRS